MNNEPVAYVTGLNKFDHVMADTVLKVGTPLYTHPAKSLTDEEIWEAIEKHMGRNFLGRCYRQSQFELSKAILREAQGK